MSNFSQFSVSERSYSDIVPPKDVVEDRTVGLKQQAIGGALDGLGSAFTTGMRMSERQQRQSAEEAEKMADEAQSRNEEAFSESLQQAVAMADKDGGPSLRAKAHLMKAFADSPLGHTDKTKMMKGLEGTFIGKVLTTPSADEVAAKAFDEQFAASTFYDPNASLGEQGQGKIAFRQALLEEEQHDLKMRGLDLEAAQAAGDKTKEAAVEKKVEEALKVKLDRLVLSVPQNVNSDLSRLRKAYEEEAASGDPAEALANYKKALDQARNVSISGIKRVATQSKTGFPTHVASATASIDALYDTEIKYAGTAEADAARQQAIDSLQVRTQLDMLNQSKPLRVSSAVADLVKGAGSALQVQALTDVNNYVLEGEERKDGGRASNLDPGQEGVEDYYEVVRNNLKNIGKTNLDGTPVVNVDALSSQTSNMLAYAFDAEGKLDLGEYSNVVKEIANPAFGKFLKTVKGEGLNEQDLSNAQGALSRYTENVVDSFNTFLQETMTDSEKSARIAKTVPRGRMAVQRKVTEDQLELVFSNDRVVFKGTDERSRAFAKGLNDRVSEQLTNTVWANANIGSSSPEAEFNRLLPALWPEKYGEEGEVTGDDEAAYIGTPDGEFTDSRDGSRYTVRNGIRIEGWE